MRRMRPRCPNEVVKEERRGNRLNEGGFRKGNNGF
jgi:hypothetical protein